MAARPNAVLTGRPSHSSLAARLSALLLALAAFAVTGPAEALGPLDFQSFPSGQWSAGQSHVENGFRLEVVSGDSFGVGSMQGNRYFAAGWGTSTQPGHVVSIRRVDGGRFRFDTFDVMSSTDNTEFWADSVRFVGRVNGMQVEVLDNVTSNLYAWETRPSGFTLAVDELRIHGVQAGDCSLLLDNLVVREAPEPGSITHGNARINFHVQGITARAAGGFRFDLEFPVDANQGFEVGWFIRTLQDTTQVRQPLPDTALYDGDTAIFTWNRVGAAGLRATLVVTIEDGSEAQDGSQGVSRWELNLTNPGGSTQVMDVFTYLDLDLWPVGNSASLVRANDWLRVSSRAGEIHADFLGQGAQAFQVAPYSDLRDLLNGPAPVTLDNSGIPFEGDFTGALQWRDRILQPGETQTFTWLVTVNEPAEVDPLFANGFEH